MSKKKRQATLAIACLDLNLSHLVRVGASEARSICPFRFFARNLASVFEFFLHPGLANKSRHCGGPQSTALRIVRQVAYNGFARKNSRNLS